MITLTTTLQIITALGLLNVWILRFNKSTSYRGGHAKNITEEFAVYGLPKWFCHLVGFLKISSAIALILGFWFPIVIKPTAGLVFTLMIGALAMHAKVKDPAKKYVPAFLVLLMTSFMLFT